MKSTHKHIDEVPHTVHPLESIVGQKLQVPRLTHAFLVRVRREPLSEEVCLMVFIAYNDSGRG